jgi:hypothetical protein
MPCYTSATVTRESAAGRCRTFRSEVNQRPKCIALVCEGSEKGVAASDGDGLVAQALAVWSEADGIVQDEHWTPRDADNDWRAAYEAGIAALLPVLQPYATPEALAEAFVAAVGGDELEAIHQSIWQSHHRWLKVEILGYATYYRRYQQITGG